jgi:GT2 family glycosyltransferase
MRTLASFRDLHSADKIVVCGCGSSLNELYRPERFVTIGVNDVGRLFQPKYLLVVDPKERFKGDRFHYVETSQAEYLFTQVSDLGVPHPDIVKFRLGEKNGASFSDPDVLHYSVVTPYMALYLAALMGSRCVGIIGVDFTDHHFFAKTGTHEWTPYLDNIDSDFRRLGAALVARGVKVFNLSPASRLTAFPKITLDEFAEMPIPASTAPSSPLRIVSYSTTPVAGVPAILSRCINARTPHYSRCVWGSGDYGNGVVYDGDLNWNQSPAAAAAELVAADVVVAHNGKVDPQHRSLLAGKPVLTLAHNYMWNVDQSFVQQGFAGAVIGQYQSTLPDFQGWTPVPNPMPLWEPAFQPGDKGDVVTICYTPSGKHEQYPKDHHLYWHSKGYDTTMRILDGLASRFPVRLEVVRDRQVSHTEALAMKRRSHILIDECVTGSYHRNSLEGLAAGCVVVNGVWLLPGVVQALRQLAGGDDFNPFTFAGLDTLESVLTMLIERGPSELAKHGMANRLWVEQHWDFALQWTKFWQPAITSVMDKAAAQRAKAKPVASVTARTWSQPSPSISVVIASLNEGDYLRRTVENLVSTLPADSEIVVVDDGSTDGSTDFISTHDQRVVLVRPAERLGSARGRNFGASHARGEVLVFCDAHVAAPPDWATPMLAALGRPEVGAVMPAIRVMRHPDDYTSNELSKEARGYGLRWRDAALSVDWLGRKGSKPYPVPLLGAAFMAIRRNVFAATGGFDPKIVTWGTEDAEYSFRLWTLGFECLVVPEVDVAHRFRNERPYRVEWETVLYNKMRLASIHFSEERKHRVEEQLKRNPGYAGALSRLAAADVEARRSHLHSLRRYDDDWFFLKFQRELSSDLAVAASASTSAA